MYTLRHLPDGWVESSRTHVRPRWLLHAFRSEPQSGCHSHVPAPFPSNPAYGFLISAVLWLLAKVCATSLWQHFRIRLVPHLAVTTQSWRCCNLLSTPAVLTETGVRHDVGPSSQVLHTSGRHRILVPASRSLGGTTGGIALFLTRHCPFLGRMGHRGSLHRLVPGASPHAPRTPPRGGAPTLRRYPIDQRGTTPTCGYCAPHLSVRGTLAIPMNALPSAHCWLIRVTVRLWLPTCPFASAYVGPLDRVCLTHRTLCQRSPQVPEASLSHIPCAASPALGGPLQPDPPPVL